MTVENVKCMSSHVRACIHKYIQIHILNISFHVDSQSHTPRHTQTHTLYSVLNPKSCVRVCSGFYQPQPCGGGMRGVLTHSLSVSLSVSVSLCLCLCLSLSLSVSVSLFAGKAGWKNLDIDVRPSSHAEEAAYLLSKHRALLPNESDRQAGSAQRERDRGVLMYKGASSTVRLLSQATCVREREHTQALKRVCCGARWFRSHVYMRRLRLGRKAHVFFSLSIGRASCRE